MAVVLEEVEVEDEGIVDDQEEEITGIFSHHMVYYKQRPLALHEPAIAFSPRPFSCDTFDITNTFDPLLLIRCPCPQCPDVPCSGEH